MEKGSAIGQSSAEYVPSSGNGSRVDEMDWEWKPQHQRAISESFLIEEQPSWLDELLDEPETPVRIGVHRRSSSDSFADTGVASAINMGVAPDSHIREIRYIAKLEGNLQDLQTEASEAFAKLESLKQEALILDMNNQVLKDWLERFAQEQLVKRLEHEEVERELARLRALTQEPQSQGFGHPRK